MRCAEAISLIWHTGHSEETHSPDECARMVVRRRRPASLSISVDWMVAISCWPRGTGWWQLTGYVSTMVRIQEAFEQAGIQFIDDDETGGFGVRMAKRKRKR
jgi:hypothetical protein